MRIIAGGMNTMTEHELQTIGQIFQESVASTAAHVVIKFIRKLNNAWIVAAYSPLQ